MTTPPVPQWAVDAGIDFCVQHCMPPDKFPALARIIAAHAPQSHEDGDMPDICYDSFRVWRHLTDEQLRYTSHDNVIATLHALKKAHDAARKKDL